MSKKIIYYWKFSAAWFTHYDNFPGKLKPDNTFKASSNFTWFIWSNQFNFLLLNNIADWQFCSRLPGQNIKSNQIKLRAVSKNIFSLSRSQITFNAECREIQFYSVIQLTYLVSHSFTIRPTIAKSLLICTWKYCCYSLSCPCFDILSIFEMYEILSKNFAVLNSRIMQKF